MKYDLIEEAQKAIDYIEDNIDEDLSFETIAKKAYMSSFYFQRIFSILCGCTLGEYIRNRRLTLSGIALSFSHEKVIDVAYKYLYKNPESFTRAFFKFHGILPSAAKKDGSQLKSFPKMVLTDNKKEKIIMDYKIVQCDAFKVAEKRKTFTMKDGENLREIPKFWTKCNQDGTCDSLCKLADGEVLKNCLLGMCYGDGCLEEFVYSIGVTNSGKKPLPKSFNLTEIPSATWAVFTARGKMPESVQGLWKDIYSSFFPSSGFVQSMDIDFEVYPMGDINSDSYETEIWIPVKKRDA
ncbi:MAG: AraC family transcriptional regulator [Bacillales bacterium]|nr:AraC family transcriptional regulator [Bacillales bacterium]